MSKRMRIAGGLILRPTERGRDALRERIGLALSPVIAQAEDDEIVPGDELVLAGENGIRRRRRLVRRLRGRRAESAHRPSRIERRLGGDDDVGAGFHGLLEHRHRRHRGRHDSFDDGGRVARLSRVSTESGFHSTPMFFLMRSITSSAVIAAAPDNVLAHANGAAGGQGGEFASGKVSHWIDES